MTEQFESSLIEEVEATDAGAQGLAAADLAGQVSRLINAALCESNLDQKDLAEKVGVTPGRVSQVVNSDGNLRIAAVARYMRAMGYELTITATPVRQGLPELPKKRAPRRGVDARRPIPIQCAQLDSIADVALDVWARIFAGQDSAIATRRYRLRARPAISTAVSSDFGTGASWTSRWHLFAGAADEGTATAAKDAVPLLCR